MPGRAPAAGAAAGGAIGLDAAVEDALELLVLGVLEPPPNQPPLDLEPPELDGEEPRPPKPPEDRPEDRPPRGIFILLFGLWVREKIGWFEIKMNCFCTVSKLSLY